MLPASFLGDKLGQKKHLIVVFSGFLMYFSSLLNAVLPACED